MIDSVLRLSNSFLLTQMRSEEPGDECGAVMNIGDKMIRINVIRCESKRDFSVSRRACHCYLN